MITFSKIGNFGRLGNQLFQIAAVLGVSKKYGETPLFPKWEYSKWFKNPINQDLNKGEIKSTYIEPKFSYSPIPHMENMDLAGYFQSEKYFSHCEDLIRHHFEFIDGIIEGEDDYSSFCSIHVRRGDYLNISDYHPIQSSKYYEECINTMREFGYSSFLIFSDDIEWCKNHFSDKNTFIFSENRSNIQDLYLMSKCGGNIIANSSFSWWGSWLNKNKNKRVIAPSLWFGPSKKGCDTSDLYCKDWIVI